MRLLFFMYSRHSEHSSYINVPVRLAKRYRNDKDGWDLLVFAICLKLQGGNSGMYLRSVPQVMKTLHCSFRKAQRLMKQAASNNVLFRYNPKTKFIIARRFSTGCKRTVAKNDSKLKFGDGYLFHDSVIKIDAKDKNCIKHNEISRSLRDLTILRILGYSPANELNCHSEHRSATRKPLTQKYLGNVAGVHQTTVSRHLRKMADGDDKSIAITSHDKIAVYDLEHEYQIVNIPNRRPFISGRFKYIRDANDYEILDKSIFDRFKHVIYNHPKRTVEHTKYRGPWDIGKML